jgi:hypothetical protein
VGEALMKVLLTLLLLLMPAQIMQQQIATTPAGVSTVTGTIATANMKLSLTNGVAFVDGGSAPALTTYLGDAITICSKTNTTECVSGYIKAAGTGETYGIQLYTNTTFANTTGWNDSGCTLSVGTGGTPNSGYLICTNTSGGYGWASPQPSVTVGDLYLWSSYIEVGTATSCQSKWLDNSGGHNLGSTASVSPGTFTQYSSYQLAPYTQTWMLQYNNDGTTGHTCFYDAPSMKQVTAPSTTGVTIVTTSGGSTFNWATNTFATWSSYYDASGWSYTITL